MGTLIQKIGRYFRFISVGQYQTKLYSDNLGQHSSIFGGLSTLICGILLLYYSVITLAATFNRDHHDVGIYSTDFNKASMKLIDFNRTIMYPLFTVGAYNENDL